MEYNLKTFEFWEVFGMKSQNFFVSLQGVKNMMEYEIYTEEQIFRLFEEV